MRMLLPIVAALAALAVPAISPAQDGTRPLDRIYGPAQPGAAQPARRSMPASPAMRGDGPPRTYDPGSRPLDRIYGPASGGGPGLAGRGGGAGAASSPGRPSGSRSLGTGPSSPSRPSAGATSKPAGPAYRGGSVGTRPRFSNSPTLSAPRR